MSDTFYQIPTVDIWNVTGFQKEMTSIESLFLQSNYLGLVIIR